jgi:hypothetical protein
MGDAEAHTSAAIITLDGLQAMLQAIRNRGYRILGPTVREGAIAYDDVDSIDAFPRGWTDEQDGGRYRLVKRDDDAFFGYAVGPQSWKRFLYPPDRRLWTIERDADGMRVKPETPSADRFAFIGVRACELRAIAIQDRVLIGGDFVDRHYEAARKSAFIVAVNCGAAGGTCFCVSMDAGPKAQDGYDLALTELIDEAGHRFLIEAGSDSGREILSEAPHRAATAAEIERAEAIVVRTAASMGRQMQSDDIRDMLLTNLNHPRWDDVASRCLSCANCTMVCPTCFCTTTEDSSDLSGQSAERRRRWDSCFTLDFSYIHGGGVRASAKSRYRQWMTHKLATWIDQFGSSGCVGCGRCITWCPVGIDITEEARAIRASPAVEKTS